MVSDPTARLIKLLASTNINDDSEAYKIATAAVQVNINDQFAHQTRIVALLKLDRFQDVIRVLENAPKKIQQVCRVEKAYALYKLGRLASAYEVLESLQANDNSERRVNHLAAQLAYKSENFSLASDLYKNLLATPNRKTESEDYDLLVNLLAVIAMMAWNPVQETFVFGTPLAEPPIQPLLDAFDSTYNRGCVALAKGNIQDALDSLGNSARLCLGATDLTDDEKKAEMVNISIQQAYACARLGRFDHAAEIASSIDLQGADVSATVFHRINSLVIQKNLVTSNPFVDQMVVSSLPQIPAEDKVFDFQSSILEYNKHAADVLAQKFDGVERTILQKLEHETGPSLSSRVNRLSSVRAAAHCNMKTGKPAIKKLLRLREKWPENIGLLLTLVGQYVAMGKPDGALTELDAFAREMDKIKLGRGYQFRCLPGIMAIKVALLQNLRRQSAIRNELCQAVKYWTNESFVPGAESLMREAGIRLIHSSESGDLSIASAAFGKLAGKSSSDDVARAGFVASMSGKDYSKVEPYIRGLDSVDKLTDTVDVDALLEEGVASLPSLLEKKLKRRAAEETSSKPAKKRRLKKLPKDYVKGRVMDPERWLPLRDRTAYKPKGKRAKKKALEAIQGGRVKEELGELLELVGGAGAVKVEKAGKGGKKKMKGKKRITDS